jgi:hypothetical protein
MKNDQQVRLRVNFSPKAALQVLTFSCENFFINLISRKILLASTGSSNALEIFLIATLSPVSLSNAEMTTP